MSSAHLGSPDFGGSSLGATESRGQGGTHHPDPEPRTTFWNGEPCEARIVRVIVGNSGRFAAPWFLDYVGQEREAVEVTHAGETFYLDNAGQHGWRKVTEGRGLPNYSHDSLDVERVL